MGQLTCRCEKTRKSTLSLDNVTLLCRDDVHRLLSSSSLKLHQSSESKNESSEEEKMLLLPGQLFCHSSGSARGELIYLYTYVEFENEKTGIQLHV